MTSIILSILKATVGRLVDKARKVAVDNLKESDVTDEQFRRQIVGEIDEIKSKLDGLARANLLASISFFKEGILYLYEVLDLKAREESANVTAEVAEGTDKDENVEVSLPSSAAHIKPVSLAKKMESLQLTDQNDPATRALSDAKGRFKDARRKSTEAFSNEALSTSDRILAMQFRVMAALLEKVDNPVDALVACKLYLEELHAMPAVQECFNVHLKKGFKSWFNKAEREEIISSVCRLNRVIYDVTQMIGKDTNLFIWPCIGTGDESVDPLRDSRVIGTVCQLGIEQFCVTPALWTRKAVTTNTQGQFIVVDKGASVCSDIKVFSSSGKYIKSLIVSIDYLKMEFCRYNSWKAVACDQDDNVYLLGNLKRMSCFSNAMLIRSTICKFDKHMNLHHRFILREEAGIGNFFVASNNELFVLTSRSDVQVYDTAGHFLCSFGTGILKQAADITYANSGCVMVLDSGDRGDRNGLIHLFSEQGEHLSQFKIAIEMPFCPRLIAFHQSSKQVLVLSENRRYPEDSVATQTGRSFRFSRIILSLYTQDGLFVRKIHLHTSDEFVVESLAVTNDGHVGMCVCDSVDSRRVLVL